MAAYGDMTVAVAGMKADASISNVTTAHAQETIDFGSVLFTYNGDWSRTGLYKTDSSTLVGDADLVADNSTLITINGVELDPVIFDTDHDTTMDLLVVAVQAAGYDAELTDTAGDNRTIAISKKFENIEVGAITTLGAGQPAWVETAGSNMVNRGIALWTQKEPGGYLINEAVSVALFGVYWVITEADVIEGDDAHFNPVTGKVTNIAGGGNIDISATFVSNALANDLVKIQIANI